MESAALNVVLFLISVIFNTAQFLMLSRFLLQYVKADFRNPFCQLILKLTNWLILPTRRLIRGAYGFDLSTLFWFYVFIWLHRVLIGILFWGHFSPFTLITAFFGAIHFYCTYMVVALFIYALMSFLMDKRFHPLGILVHHLVEPILEGVRRIIPRIAGFDLSPFFAILGFQILNLVLPG